MFDVFSNAMRDLARKVTNKNVSMNFRLGAPCENRSASLAIDTKDFVAEIVVWATGDYFAEIVEVSTEKSLLSKSGILTSNQKIEEVFKEFFEVLGIVFQ